MTQGLKACSLCSTPTQHLITECQLAHDSPLLDALEQYHQNWELAEGICTRCLSDAHESLQHTLLDVNTYSGDAITVLPTPLRLNAHPNYTGKGITICLIDSGFYLHPDIEERVKTVKDITNLRRKKNYFLQPHNNAWHGTMTSVVCAGNGTLSKGIYRGIASKADLVLLKVMDEAGHISEEHIVKALQWVNKNHATYDIRIVNLSVTGDYETSFHESKIAKTIKELVEKGIVVVAAIGNNIHAPILPPASVPEVIAVGGLNDKNTLDPLQQTLYHSTYGATIDGLLKPELIAPSIWLAAPILPKSDASKQAAHLFERYHKSEGAEKEHLLREIKNRKLLSPHYQHADGTSFAAPIVCSIIAQMLEANPILTVSMIREILITTARPLSYENLKRQGYGVVQAAHALIKAKQEHHQDWISTSPIIDERQQLIHFYFHNHYASKVALAGNFNYWSRNHFMTPNREAGYWLFSLPILPKGTYSYKYIVDGENWVSDPRNYFKIDDGYGGYNSQFQIF